MSDQIRMYDSVQGQGQQLSAQKLCPCHSNKECIFICTDPARIDELVFKCEFCVVEQTLQSKYLLPISQLATSDLKTVFWHWPLPDNQELIEKVRALSTREKPDAAYKQKIDKFFKEMRIEVMARIDEVQAAMNKRAETLWDFDHTILEQYGQLSAKEALKSAVLDTSEGLEQLSERIRRTVTGVLSDTQATTASLAGSLDQLALQESAVDFTGPQRIKDEILANISRISMFLVEDMQDLQMQQAQISFQLQEMEAAAEGNLDVILKLASCRFNDLSQEFKERMSSQLQKFKKIFERIELGDVREESKRVAEFDSLGEEEVAEVKAFADRLIEAKKKRERGNNGNSLKIEDLMRLLQNKANHASEEMMAQSQALLEGVSRYVSTFEVDFIHKEGFEMETFQGMSDQEISIAGKAIQEMKALFGQGQPEKAALEEVANVGKQIMRSMAQPLQQYARSLSSDKIMEFVKNETNFCSEEFVNSSQAALKGVQLYLESFQLTEQENEGLEREQLSSLGKLGRKMKDLSARYGEGYKARQSPNGEEQPKSTAVSRWASNHIEANGLKELNSLLCKLPVIELTECEWKLPISIQWKWMKTGYDQSSTLQLQNEGNGVRVIQTTMCRSQAVTENTLENKLVYAVKCTFNKPLNGVQYLVVGLIPDDKINGSYFVNNGKQNFWSNPEYGPTQIIKGQLLNSAALNTTLTTILFRFCIETQTYLVSDPTLQNISQLDKDKINPNTKYRFGICFYSNFGSDYSCLFSDVTTSQDQASVNFF